MILIKILMAMKILNLEESKQIFHKILKIQLPFIKASLQQLKKLKKPRKKKYLSIQISLKKIKKIIVPQTSHKKKYLKNLKIK